MISVKAHDRGAVLAVHARPGAKRDKILGEHNGALGVLVAAAPDKGKANEAIIRLLAEELNLRRSQFTILTGVTARDKNILIEGVTALDIVERLEAILDPTDIMQPETEKR